MARGLLSRTARWCFTFVVVLTAYAGLVTMVNMSRKFAVPPNDAKIGILVTGCASGLGYDLVRALLEDYPQNKNIIVFAGVRKEKDLAVFESFKNKDRIVPLVLDVANPEHVEAAVQTVRQSGIPLFGLVNNAGIGMSAKRIHSHPGKEYTEAVEEVLDVNLFGLAHLTGASLDLLRAASAKVGSARIINISSIMGVVFTPRCGGYCASKHALEALSADWRFELDPYNISVSSIQPGFFKTSMCKRAFCTEEPLVCSNIVMKALFSDRPVPRYQCARVFGIPASVVTALIQIVPDRLVDFVLRTFEDLESKGNVDKLASLFSRK